MTDLDLNLVCWALENLLSSGFKDLKLLRPDQILRLVELEEDFAAQATNPHFRKKMAEASKLSRQAVELALRN